jgi:hypothetical protein
MKKIFNVLFMIAISMMSFAQTRNTQTATELLNLPEWVSEYDGIITSHTTRTITLNRVHDFTNGRKVIDSYSIEEKTSNVSHYALNYIANRTVGDGLTSNEIGKYSRDVIQRNGSWFAAIDITFTNNGLKKFESVRSAGMNTTVTVVNRVQTATPTNYDNPPEQVSMWEWTKTATKTTKSRRARIINIPLNQILQTLGIDRATLEYQLRETFTITPRPILYIHSTGVEAEAVNGGYRINPYYDGVSLYNQSASGRITSYNKQWPGVKLRWIVYNGENRVTTTGSTLLIQYENINDQTNKGPVKFQASDRCSFDAATNTIFYDSSKPCEVWAVFEENPAQFKQWQSEKIYLVQNGVLVEK